MKKRTNWRRPSSRRARPRQTMETHIADVCACLDGDVYLQSREGSADMCDDAIGEHVPPIPWIVVHFRTKAPDTPFLSANNLENLDPNTNPPHSNAKHAHTHSSTVKAIHAPTKIDPKDSGRLDDLQNARGKLAAIRFLSLAACCPEYSWRGNPAFWHHVLTNLCGAHDRDEYFSQGRGFKQSACTSARHAGERVFVMPAFRMVVTDVKVTSDLLELYREAFSADPKDEIYCSVNQRVMNLLAGLGIALPTRSQNVEIDLCFQNAQLIEDVSMRGIQGIFVETSNSKHTREMRLRFRLRGLNLAQTALSSRDLALLTQIMARSGLSVRKLNLSWVFTPQAPHCYMPAFGTLMGACFAAEPLHNAGEISATSLTKLNLDYNELSVFHLASLFSAIHAGKDQQHGVRELSLKGFCGNQSWLWLAFGIFHRTSNAQLRDLDLSHCVLRLENIELVRNLLNSADYAPHLVKKRSAKTCRRPARDSYQDLKHEWILLPAGARLQAPREQEKHRRGISQDVLELQTELWCEALQRGKRWTCVLVPGYGILWVTSSKIIKAENCDQHDNRVNSFQQQRQQLCKLETLTMASIKTVSQVLHVDKDEHLRGSTGAQSVDHVISEWMLIVGQSLQTLCLSGNPLTDHTVTIIIESCPLLQNLDIEGCELTSIAPVTDAFRQENCRLRSLNAAHNDIGTVSQTNLFRVLGDLECDAARNLQVLYLEDNPVSSSNRLLSLIVNPTLKKNKTLRKLKISMDTKHESAAILRRSFATFQGEWLTCEKLPCKHRWALLSIPCIKAMPTVVVEIIFEFAKRDIYRQVQWEEWYM